MSNFRNPTLCERIEDVVFDLQTPLISQVANGAHQAKNGYRFVTDNTGEVSPFDWYDSRFLVDFKLVKLANGANIAVDDHNGMVNSVHSLIKRIDVKVNGIPVYDNAEANQPLTLRIFSSMINHTLIRQVITFIILIPIEILRKDQLKLHLIEGLLVGKWFSGLQISLVMRYPWTGMGFSKLSKINFYQIRRNLVWQAADSQLYVPRIQFNSAGTQNYMNNYLKPHKWTYLREMVERSQSLRQQTGTFKITSGINRPRQVFIYILNDARLNDQTQNPFLYDTFNVANNRKLTSCHLEVGNGNQYPEVEFTPSTDVPRVFREVNEIRSCQQSFQRWNASLKIQLWNNIPTSLLRFIKAEGRNQRWNNKTNI